ncbi:MAG: pyrimidine dimer DNA glycosylase/endonuclease V [Methanomassiliicoccus sp.]|nr:pyrimidine dimer DNA glycosylase/endonuclease V [Methanomassiliicoccus sp.]
MRLWSIHPRYLDPPGLGGLWREALLAQGVVAGRTLAYRNHPQTRRLLEQPDPWGAIHDYLIGVWDEAHRRGYAYQRSRILPHAGDHPMEVPRGQFEYEAALLRLKLEARSPRYLAGLPRPGDALPHPSIRMVEGGIAWWERPRKEVLRRLVGYLDDRSI